MRLNLLRGATAAAACALLVSCADVVNAPRPVGTRGVTATVPKPKVVISQVYGAGGNSNALLNADYVELFNAGNATQDLSTWSVQYTSATGTGNFGSNKINLTGSIEPGQYYLVKLAQGANGAALPAADVSGGIGMAAGAGKVIVANTQTGIACNGGSTPCPAALLAQIADLVGYGTGSSGANYFEGASAAPTISTTLAAFRKDNGCTDTDNNGADFVAATPGPRNTLTTKAPCAIAEPLDAVEISGAATLGVGSTTTLTAELEDASGATIVDPAASYVWTSSDAAIAEVVSTSGNAVTIRGLVVGGPVSINVTATSRGITRSSTPHSISVTPAPVIHPSTTVVSEVHYDNPGTDANERFEIEGDAGSSIDGWSLVLYNGNGGTVYSTTPLSGVIPGNCENGRGVIVIPFPASAGIQNGSPDGWALVNAQNQVTEFRSYEGSMTASDGPAAGLVATPLEADETTPAPSHYSVQRAGNGVWFGPKSNSFGRCNPAEPAPGEKIVLEDGKDLLALGMQTQFFYTGTDNAGQPVTSVTWSSSNANVITVDARGIVTGKSLGIATLTATAHDGAIGTIDITVYLAPGSSGIRLGHNTEFGEPEDGTPTDDFLIRRGQYTVSYNPNRGGANWVSWNLSASHLGGSGRCSGTCYSADTALSNAGIPAYTTADWVSGGVWDRGHMAPSADWTASEADNNTTFFLTNFLPQAGDLNQGPWERLESALRDSVTLGKREVYVIAGGIFSNGTGLGSIQNLGKIWIPDSTWKIAVIVPAGTGIGAGGTLPANSTVLAVNMPNVEGIRALHWSTWLTSVAKIEASTGYDFLDLLSDPTECVVEQRNCAPVVAAFDGATLLRNETYSAAGSFSDPNADTWTGTVSYGDGTTSALAISGKTFNLSHDYMTAGSYTVTVTVTDGTAAHSRSATVVVKSAAQGIADLEGLLPGLGANLGQMTSLRNKLSNAQKHLDDNQAQSVHQLEQFIEEIDKLVEQRRANAVVGQQLIAYARRVIGAI
jgi:DNA/RNA endonuclease G (NUC1)